VTVAVTTGRRSVDIAHGKTIPTAGDEGLLDDSGDAVIDSLDVTLVVPELDAITVGRVLGDGVVLLVLTVDVDLF
jgi:hypothetical protein